MEAGLQSAINRCTNTTLQNVRISNDNLKACDKYIVIDVSGKKKLIPAAYTGQMHQQDVKCSFTEFADSFPVNFDYTSGEEKIRRSCVTVMSLYRCYMVGGSNEAHDRFNTIDTLIPAVTAFPSPDRGVFYARHVEEARVYRVEVHAKHERKVEGMTKTIIQFTQTSKRGESLLDYINGSERENLKRSIANVLEVYFGCIKWSKSPLMKYDPVILFCKFTMYSADEIEDKRFYTVMRWTINIVKYTAIALCCIAVVTAAVMFVLTMLYGVMTAFSLSGGNGVLPYWETINKIAEGINKNPIIYY